MAKAQKAAGDVSAEFVASLTELQKVSARADVSRLQTRSGTLARGVDVCGVYAKARPILEIVIRIPFIPKKAKEVIKLLMSALDTLCPR
jgi:hypothetical protein